MLVGPDVKNLVVASDDPAWVEAQIAKMKVLSPEWNIYTCYFLLLIKISNILIFLIVIAGMNRSPDTNSYDLKVAQKAVRSCLRRWS